jgi:Domain of unknown function (DUF4384)
MWNLEVQIVLSQKAFLAAKYLKKLPAFLFVFALLLVMVIPPIDFANPPQDTRRTIVSDDFVKNRPRAGVQTKSTGKSGKVPDGKTSSGRRVYRLASQPLIGPGAKSSFSKLLQLGLTVWKLRPATVADSSVLRSIRENGRLRPMWIEERVEADTRFHQGEYLRLSIESPHAGYLYVIDRDWFADGSSGDTNLIFPIRGDDNLLQAGRLIDIPAENQTPFKATPKFNQAGEILTIMVTSTPLRLPISGQPLPISNTQLMEWEAMWGGVTERFEMEGGAGQVRTKEEEQAAARNRTRQLTRDDPGPQTIYVLTPRNRSGLLFNVNLSYIR